MTAGIIARIEKCFGIFAVRGCCAVRVIISVLINLLECDVGTGGDPCPQVSQTVTQASPTPRAFALRRIIGRHTRSTEQSASRLVGEPCCIRNAESVFDSSKHESREPELG